MGRGRLARRLPVGKGTLCVLASGAVTERQKVSPVDARVLILSAVLEPALSLARILGLTLDDLQQLVAIGYFREYRLRGMSQPMIAKRLGKSIRTVATLSKLSEDEGPPLGGSQRIGWRRRIVSALASRGPQPADDLERQLPDAEPEALAEALEQLLDDGILSREGERFAVVAPEVDMIREDFDYRLESLRHFLVAVTQTVYQRFFAKDSGAEAFARVLSFSTLPDRLRAIRQSSYDAMEKAVEEADAEATGKPDAVQGSVAVCFVEVPTDLPWRIQTR